MQGVIYWLHVCKRRVLFIVFFSSSSPYVYANHTTNILHCYSTIQFNRSVRGRRRWYRWRCCKSTRKMRHIHLRHSLASLALCTVCVDCVNEFFRWRGKLVALSMTYLFLVYDDWNGGNFPVDCKWPKKKNKTKSFSTGISNKRSQCKHMKLLPINHILFTPLTIFRIDSWNRIEI